MSGLVAPPEWYLRSDDGTPRRFGDIVEAGTLWTAAKYDAVLVGEPFDGPTPDTATATPVAVREALAHTTVGHDDATFDGRLADLGDVGIPHSETDVRTVQETVRGFTARIHAGDTVPIFFGGNGVLTYPNAAPLLEDGRVGVVRFGSVHGRAGGDSYPAARRSYSQLFEAGLESMAVVGTHRSGDAISDWGPLRDRDWQAVSVGDVQSDPAAAATTALDSLGDVDTVFLSVDLPVLDGFTAEMTAAVERIAGDRRVACLEVITGDSGARSVDRGGSPVAEAVGHFLIGLER